jgi:hypothetical protein
MDGWMGKQSVVGGGWSMGPTCQCLYLQKKLIYETQTLDQNY